MSNELVIPEIVLLDELERNDNALSPMIWEDKRCQLIEFDAENNNKSSEYILRKRMFMSDFVNKVVNKPIIIQTVLPENTMKQLYRLHLYCCQQAVFEPEVKRNPFILGFHALKEMKLALVAIFISYRLINPHCPYSWSKEFFYKNINIDKTSDGNTTILFGRIPSSAIVEAINEDVVTDWFIYREHDHNGVRTLMDIKNNLLTIPDYVRGGDPASEFSRFERKMQEEKNRVQKRKDEALDIEFRKVMVQKIAEETADRLISSGMSKTDLMNKIFKADLSSLLEENNEEKGYKSNTIPNSKKKNVVAKQDTKLIENVICQFLDEDS